MSALIAFYRNLPRAGRWLVLFGAFCIGYFLVIDKVMQHTAEVRLKADQLESDFNRERALADTTSEEGRALSSGIANFGQPMLPVDRNNRAESLNRTVDEVLARHAITNSTKTEKNPSFGAAPQIPVIAGSGATAQRIVLEIAFEATPEKVIAVLADLERAPGVAAVGRLRIDRTSVSARYGLEDLEEAEDPARLVRATIAPEAWVVVRSGAASAAGGSTP